MTNIEFKAALNELGVSQRRFAEITGAAPNTVSRWATGRLAVPLIVKRLLDAWRVAGVPTHTTDPA